MTAAGQMNDQDLRTAPAAVAAVAPRVAGHRRTARGWLQQALFLVLLVVESSDLVFAVDSIPAIYAVTSDPFIVFTSNIFAILGLRSLYFVLAGYLGGLRYLKPALAAVLMFVGAKMALVDFVKVPPLASLGVILAILVGAVVASLVVAGREGEESGSQEVATHA